MKKFSVYIGMLAIVGLLGCSSPRTVNQNPALSRWVETKADSVAPVRDRPPYQMNDTLKNKLYLGEPIYRILKDILNK
ncbi:MAG: hypothetical protein IJ456_06610 [Bacteroides sp.]|nr:hypothetical protein [Bacteroides sp.]